MGIPCIVSHDLATYEHQQFKVLAAEAHLEEVSEEIKSAIRAGGKYRVSPAWLLSADDVLIEVADEHSGISSVCALLLEGKLSDETAGRQLRYMLNAALNKLAVEAATQKINMELEDAAA